MRSARRFAIVDRDGTLIRNKAYLADPEGVELLDGADEAIRRLRAAGLGIVVVTNQSGVGRGRIDLTRLAEIHDRLERRLAASGARLDGIYFCPHLPGDACDCRKPRAGLVRRAALEHDFDPRRSYVIGDDRCDVELGRRIGAVSLLVRTGHGESVAGSGDVHPDYVVKDLAAAAAIIEELSSPGTRSEAG